MYTKDFKQISSSKLNKSMKSIFSSGKGICLKGNNNIQSETSFPAYSPLKCNISHAKDNFFYVISFTFTMFIYIISITKFKAILSLKCELNNFFGTKESIITHYQSS